MAKITHLTPQAAGGTARRRIPLQDLPIEFDAPLGTIGQDLRAARLARGEDVDTASRILKIRKDHLEAIEEDRLGALPGRTYAVGFVRAYASHLGLDPAKIAERFKTEIAGRDETSRNAGFVEPAEEPERGWGWIFVGLVVLGLIAYGGYRLASAPASQAQRPIPAVPQKLITGGAGPLRGTPAKTPVAAKPQRLPPAAAPPASATVANPAVAPGPGGWIYGKQNLNPHVVLRVKQPTHLLVQNEDGKVYINRILQPGDIYRAPNVPGLSLSAEHGNAVEIFSDGKPVGTAGPSANAAEALPLDSKAIAAKGAAANANPAPPR